MFILLLLSLLSSSSGFSSINTFDAISRDVSCPFVISPQNADVFNCFDVLLLRNIPLDFGLRFGFLVPAGIFVLFLLLFCPQYRFNFLDGESKYGFADHGLE